MILRERFKRAGVTQRIIHQGEIYLVLGDLIQLPKSRLPGHQKKKRKSRAVLIVQGERDNQDILYPIVSVAPLSSRVDLKGKQDIELCAAPQKLYRVDLLESSSLAAGPQVFKVR